MNLDYFITQHENPNKKWLNKIAFNTKEGKTNIHNI